MNSEQRTAIASASKRNSALRRVLDDLVGRLEAVEEAQPAVKGLNKTQRSQTKALIANWAEAGNDDPIPPEKMPAGTSGGGGK